MGLDKIDAEFVVNTPMFMGGAENSQAELRLPSILGALRFWYRATAPGDLVQNVEELRKAEARLFGSSTTGQGAFLSRLTVGKLINPKLNLQDEVSSAWEGQGSAYLGYGIIGLAKKANGPGSINRIQRNYIKEGTTFIVSFIMRPKIKEPDNQSEMPDLKGLVRAIKALGLFGGLGSRSRRGFGSVTLTSLTSNIESIDDWHMPASKDDLYAAIKTLLQELPQPAADLPPYTAFSKKSKVVITYQDNNSRQLLDQIGKEMVRYRSYGHKSGGIHKLPWGEKALGIFADDHDLVLAVANGQGVGSSPRRVAFGLPHNYFFSSIRKKVDITSKTYQRRSSPLLIHIHALANGYTAVLTYLPGQFLPECEPIVMRGGTTVEAAPDIKDQVITDFLERFPGRMEVRM